MLKGWQHLREHWSPSGNMRMRVLTEILHYLVSIQAARQCAGDTLAREHPDEQVGQDALAACEQPQDGHMQQ